MNDEDEDGPAVNCQPVFVDPDSDEDQTQANGDAESNDDWRRWTD